MYVMRGLALVSLVTLVACGGGNESFSGTSSGSVGESRADQGFNGSTAAFLSRATVAPTAQGSVAVNSNQAYYSPSQGTMRVAASDANSSGGYSGPYSEGEWTTDRNGNELLVTNPANTQFVRQIEIVETIDYAGTSQTEWHQGVIGFATPSMPQSGNVTYNGVTSGNVIAIDGSSGAISSTDYQGNVQVTANMGTGRGNFALSNVSSTSGGAVPFNGVNSQFQFTGNQISSVGVGNTTINVTGQPTINNVFSDVNGHFFGPNAAEVGAGYHIETNSMMANGAFVARR